VTIFTALQEDNGDIYVAWELLCEHVTSEDLFFVSILKFYLFIFGERKNKRMPFIEFWVGSGSDPYYTLLDPHQAKEVGSGSILNRRSDSDPYRAKVHNVIR
jgi:hypothetical protein